MPDLTKPFGERLDEVGIPHFDLTTVLSERTARGERLFREVDIHPNRQGYRLIAEAIANYLDGHAFLTAGGRDSRLLAAREGGTDGIFTACRGDERSDLGAPQKLALHDPSGGLTGGRLSRRSAPFNDRLTANGSL